jgi:hypothetical protein
MILEAARLGRGAVRTGVARRASPSAVLRRAATLRRHGFSATEARLFGLFDPALGGDELARFTSRREGYALQDRLNPESFRALAEDKALFARFCGWHDVPTAELLALHNRDAPGWSPRGHDLTGPAEWIAFIRERLPSEFVLKPAWGHLGEGVRVVVRERGAFQEVGGGRLDAEDLLAIMDGDARWPAWIVQERVRNHPDLRRLSASEAVQTVRAITLVRRDGRVEVLWADLRVVMGDAQVDNWRDGSTGNGLAPVDLGSGRIGPVVAPAPSGEGTVVHEAHPRSGVRFDDVALPGWTDAVRLLKRVAPELAPLRAVGWDVVLTEGGPLILEVQARWGPHNQSRAMPGIMAAMAAEL